MKELPCAEVYPDDGRKSDGRDHKGNWGRHKKNDRLNMDGGFAFRRKNTSPFGEAATDNRLETTGPIRYF